MPLPKRQHSKQRGRKRRTHWKARVASLSSCTQCQKLILPHRICPFCGYFKGTQILTARVKSSKSKSS